MVTTTFDSSLYTNCICWRVTRVEEGAIGYALASQLGQFVPSPPHVEEVRVEPHQPQDAGPISHRDWIKLLRFMKLKTPILEVGPTVL